MLDPNTDNGLAALEASIKKEIIKQGKLTRKKLDRNKARIDSSLLILGGGLVAVIMLNLGFESKTISDERFNTITEYVFEFMALSAVGGTGYAAIKRDHKKNSEDENDEIESEENE